MVNAAEMSLLSSGLLPQWYWGIGARLVREEEGSAYVLAVRQKRVMRKEGMLVGDGDMVSASSGRFVC